jgi:hypothetical protein
MTEIALRIAGVGAGATLIMDLWGLVLRRVYGVAGLDYRLLGRWIGRLLRGQCSPDGVARAIPVRGEALIGWAAHYAIGVLFAAALVAAAGTGWLNAPAIAPALLTGLVTVAAPLLILQPALGLGVAASRAPDPTAARLRSVITHLVFGAGLYAAGLLQAACNQLSQL